MKKEKILALIKALGGYQVEDRGDWLNYSCPFAFWRHKKGTDSNPSSGIRVVDQGESFFKCWSCGKVVSLAQMVMELQYLNSNNPSGIPVDFKQCWAIVSEEESELETPIFNPVDYETIPKEETTVFFPELWLGSFLSIKEHWYFSSRQVSKALVTKYRFVYDVTDMRVCFPLRDAQGDLIGLQGRSVKKSPDLRYRYYQYQGKSNSSIMGAENSIDLDLPLVICEGVFDLLRIASVYQNVCFSLTSALSNKKLQRLEDAEQVISFFDWGTGGDFARKKVKHFFGKSLIEHVIPDARVGDPGNMSKDSIWEKLNGIIPWLLKEKGNYF